MLRNKVIDSFGSINMKTGKNRYLEFLLFDLLHFLNIFFIRSKKQYFKLYYYQINKKMILLLFIEFVQKMQIGIFSLLLPTALFHFQELFFMKNNNLNISKDYIILGFACSRSWKEARRQSYKRNSVLKTTFCR
jgi:hypothetical protein